jgi:biotin synthase
MLEPTMENRTYRSAETDHQNNLGGEVRTDWVLDEVRSLFDLPFNDLLFKAQNIHRVWFNPNKVQMSTLLSIKTGGCPEDCGYCSQSVKFDTGLDASALMKVEEVLKAARQAKDGGATRFCMGAAWRNPKDRDMDAICAMIEGVKSLGMESCATLGMLTAQQAEELKAAGLDYYNHNIDTSRRYYKEIISTRTMDDRIETLDYVRSAGLNVCCGGIVGMGESRDDRIDMLHALATMPSHPQSVPINMLVRVEGTPLGGSNNLDSFDFVKTIAVARILMPKSVVRLSAGRENMNEEFQALCFAAGANSIFIGEELLTTPNPKLAQDRDMFARLGIEPMMSHECPAEI